MNITKTFDAKSESRAIFNQLCQNGLCKAVEFDAHTTGLHAHLQGITIILQGACHTSVGVLDLAGLDGEDRCGWAEMSVGYPGPDRIATSNRERARTSNEYYYDPNA